jgi:spermidine/putrescine transport system substrate-binding protein
MTDRLTRSDLLRRAAVGGAALAVPGALAAFAEAAGGPDPSKLRGKTFVFSNWPYYIDVKNHRHPSLDQFGKRYGVKVRYIEDINDNGSFFGKIQAQLRRGQSIGRDLIVMTDNSPYPALLVKNKWVEKLDKSVLPNMKNLVPALRHPAWDPNRDYSLPWVSGLDGIGYNAKLTKPVTTVDQLLTDKRLKGKVTLLNEMGDTMTLVMLSNGDDPTKVDDASFNRALKKIQKAVKSGQIRQFTGNEYGGMMARGDVWAAFVWSGDIVQLQPDNKSLRFTLPESGGGIWTDNMMIPKNGDAYLASVYMNFVYDPKIYAEIDGYITYISDVLGTDKVLQKIEPAKAKNPLIFPTPAMLKRVHQFDPNALFNADYKQKWQKLLGA